MSRRQSERSESGREIRRGTVRTAVILGCAMIAGAAQGRAHDMSDVNRLLVQASHQQAYVPATAEQLTRCEELFVRTLQGPRDDALTKEWADFGWKLRPLTIQGHAVWVVYESTASRRGWGFYLICPERMPGVVLQAPHSFSDEMTQTLAIELMDEGTFAAGAWNTIRRDRVDVAHTSEHPYSAFTRALVKTFPACVVVQLHGYAQGKRASLAGTDADMIISNGDDAPDPLVRKTASLMQANAAWGLVKLYPDEIRELGATTNVQAELMRQHGSDRFIHFELSHPLRVKLITDERARQVFLKNLQRGVE